MIPGEIATHPTDQGNASEKQQRLSSRWRGLYYDAKHAAWRVRIFYQGKQRHIGRYKDETLAAQAYDRAAYYLYGTRANLNFRLVDVLADPSDVPASIKLAKEQPFVGTRLQGPFNANTGCGSSSSSTCSYSPHSSRQAHSMSMHSSPACGFIQGYVTAGDPLQQQQQQQVLMCMPQQQQQMAACVPAQQQLLSQQQAGTISNLHPGWVQQQQLAGGTGAFQAYASTGLMQPAEAAAGMLQPQGMHAMQQQVMPQGVVGVAPAGLPLSLQQQQQVAISAAAMPDVVTSMIAGLCWDDNHSVPQSTALVTSSRSTHATPWTPSVHCSMGQAAGLQAAHAAGTAHFPGFLTSSSTAGAASSSSAGLLLAQGSQQQHLGWTTSSGTAYQGAPGVQLGSTSNDSSMLGKVMPVQFNTAAVHTGNVPMSVPISSTAGQVMPLGYLPSNGQASSALQQQQQARMLQLQSHGMSGPGFTSPHGIQHSTQHDTAGGVYHAQQLAGDVGPLQVMLPNGVVLNSSQLYVMQGAWPQQ